MDNKKLFWSMFALIVALCCADYQLFTEGEAHIYSPIIRQAGHIAILVAIIPVGYLGWKNHPVQWIKKIWLYSYVLFAAFVVCIGLVQYKYALFNTPILDRVSSMRLFFCSPVPYFMLYVLQKVINQQIIAPKA